MTTNDLEKRREYLRRWRAANPDKVRQHKERSKEANRERARLAYQADPEAARERQRQWTRAHPEVIRERNRRAYLANRERELERQRLNRASGYKTPRQREHAAVVAKFWREQGECCYLCQLPVALESAVLEHDHRCCPKQNTYCNYCVRGAACSACNTAIGLLRDDPDLMERVARNLRATLAEADRRIATKPVQAELDIAGAT